jgi:hypothetical protein
MSDPGSQRPAPVAAVKPGPGATDTLSQAERRLQKARERGELSGG